MTSKRIVLKFPRRLVDQPIVCTLVKRYGLQFNILKASITPREEGLMVLEISGDDVACSEGLRFLADSGVSVQPLSQDIRRNENRCIHCGACIGVCPSGALALDQQTRRVNFDSALCIACELCVAACPPRAMEVRF